MEGEVGAAVMALDQNFNQMANVVGGVATLPAGFGSVAGVAAVRVTAAAKSSSFFQKLFNALGAKGGFQVGKSLGAAATRISVRGASHLAEGSKVTNIRKIADGRENREVGRLVEQYGGKAKGWLKRSGDADVVTTSGNVRRAEVHWYEAHGVGKVEFKVKTWLD